jgi:hypothetical protein
MSEIPGTLGGKRNVLVRGLLILLMAVAFQIAATLLAVAAVVQFALVLVNETPNARLISLGKALGLYLGQIAGFVTFASEDAPFPFSAWPAET